MKTLCLLVASVAGVLVGGSDVGRAGSPTTICVNAAQSHCFQSIQAAVDGAQTGDTIVLGAGVFQGGVTITKSIRIVGVSAGATVVAGGGPVVTIGTLGGANSGLRVELDRLTISGGANAAAGNAFGGGVAILQGDGPAAPGATVDIDASVITDNQAAPAATFPSDPAPCTVPAAQCAFALGGGIANAGVLTLTNSRVTDNLAGSPGITRTSRGAGIYNGATGTLTVRDSVVSGNQAVVSPPNGCFTEGGGIEDFGTMTVENSRITGNSSVVVSSVPSSILGNDLEQNADAGGIDLSPNASATISNSNISDNTVSDFDSGGDAQSFNGGIDGEGTLALSGSIVDRNTVSARVPAGSGLVTAATAGGVGLSGGSSTIRSSHIGGNRLDALSASGVAFVGGAGIEDVSAQLAVDRTVVTANSAGAIAAALTLALGGGILDTSLGGLDPQMTLTDSVVTANRLTANSSTPLGGGVFNGGILGGGPYPITLTGTVIEGNSPDQCAGC